MGKRYAVCLFLNDIKLFGDVIHFTGCKRKIINEDNGKIIVENYNFDEEEKAMFEVLLKAKTETKEKQGSISIKGAESSMGITAMKADEASLVVKVQNNNTMLIIIIGSILILAIVVGMVIYFILKKKKGEN